MANLIPEIAKMLGLKLGEEFKITGGRLSYRFTVKNLETFCEGDGWGLCHPDALVNLIEGRCDVIKLPWHPRLGDTYWTYSGNDFDTFMSKWAEAATDYARLKCGCVFRTREEALKVKPRVYKELTGKDWRGET